MNNRVVCVPTATNFELYHLKSLTSDYRHLVDWNRAICTAQDALVPQFDNQGSIDESGNLTFHPKTLNHVNYKWIKICIFSLTSFETYICKLCILHAQTYILTAEKSVN